jgi:hypothetical protein
MSPHTQGRRGNPQGKGETTAAWSLHSGASEMGPLHTRRGQVEDHAKASWRTRVGAMGGGTAESFRCRRICRITSPCVRTPVRRSALQTPGPASQSECKPLLEQPRPAPAPRHGARLASGSPTSCWRGVRMRAPRKWLYSPRAPTLRYSPPRQKDQIITVIYILWT